MAVYKLPGSAIQANTITTTQLQTTVVTQISAGGGPKVKSLIYPGDDTAANTVGGQTLYITGSGFAANAQVLVNGAAVPSQSFISASNISFTTPALSTGTYPVYVINPEDGGTAILYPGLLISGEPTWSTGATLPAVDVDSTWSISLSATGDAPITYALAAGNTLPSGITLAANGLISGTLSSPPVSETTYNFSVVASDAQNQDSTRQFSITASVRDLYFPSTILSIHANGTNNGNNHAFVDSSNNNFTITRYGNATQGSFSPYSQTGWSVYLDGGGDYLSYSAGSTLSSIGAGPVTIEAWVFYMGNHFSYEDIFIVNSAGMLLDAGKLRFYGLSATAAPTNLVKNTWVHLAVVRESNNNLKGYIGGSQVFSTTSSTSFGGSSGATAYIGSWSSGGGEYFPGYISNLRVSNSARYTANFTPSTTQFTSDANTVLLACQTNRFIDTSTNNFTLTRNGDARIVPFSPFAPTSAYSAANNGGSIYLDGTGDYISTPTTPANFGANNFTVETWVWFTTNSVGYQPLLHCTGAADYDGWGMITETTNILWFLCSTNGSSWTNTINTTVTPTINCWTHLAIVRNGGTITYYINGVASGTTSIGASSIDAPSNAFYTGYYPYFPGGARAFNGYFSGTRLINGSALYTSNFTPPTAPPTPVANTSLLQNYTNAQIFDQTAKNVLETVGDAKVSTAQYKYGTASMYFDGTGDWLIARNNPLASFDSGDFTIEAWIYPVGTTGSDRCILDTRLSANDSGMALFISTTGNLSIFTSNGIRLSSSGTLTSNTWQHIALVRSSGTMAFYIDGTQSGTVSWTTSITCPGRITIGARHDDAAAYTGYIDDLRVTKGVARYTSNFTPPTSAHMDK